MARHGIDMALLAAAQPGVRRDRRHPGGGGRSLQRGEGAAARVDGLGPALPRGAARGPGPAPPGAAGSARSPCSGSRRTASGSRCCSPRCCCRRRRSSWRSGRRIRASRWRRTGARGCTGSPCGCTGGWSRPNAAPRSGPGRRPRTVQARPAVRRWCSPTGAAGSSRPTPRRSPLSAGAGASVLSGSGFAAGAAAGDAGGPGGRCAARAPCTRGVTWARRQSGTAAAGGLTPAG